MARHTVNEEAARQDHGENNDRRTEQEVPDLVIEPPMLPAEYIKPILMSIPQLDLSAPSKINKIYYTVKIPELQDFELGLNYAGLEADMASIRREKSIKREKFLSKLSVHLVRSCACLAAAACVILGYQGKRDKFAAMALAVLVAINTVVMAFCVWDLCAIKR